MIVDDTLRRFGVNKETLFFKCNVQLVPVLDNDDPSETSCKQDMEILG